MFLLLLQTNFISVNLFPTTDYSKGFGGKYGVEKDRVDKTAVGWDHQEKVEKHESQKGRGFLTTIFKQFAKIKNVRIFTLSSYVGMCSPFYMYYTYLDIFPCKIP